MPLFNNALSIVPGPLDALCLFLVDSLLHTVQEPMFPQKVLRTVLVFMRVSHETAEFSRALFNLLSALVINDASEPFISANFITYTQSLQRRYREGD